MGNSGSVSFKDMVGQLLEQDFSKKEFSFWREIFSSAGSTTEVFTSISLDFIQRLQVAFPENLSSIANASLRIIEMGGDRQLVRNALRFTTRLLSLILEHPQLTPWEPDYSFRLVDALAKLLFFPGISLDVRSSISEYELDLGRLWSAGLYIDDVPSVSGEMLEMRVETMRCMLTSFTSIIYKSFADCKNYVDSWAWIAVSGQVKHSKDLFLSLMNTALSFNMDGLLGYFADEECASTACQLLVVLLASRTPSQIDNPVLEKTYSILQEKSGAAVNLSNAVAEYIKEIREEPMLEFIFRNICRLLSGMKPRTSYMPANGIKYYQEVLLLFWQICDKNAEFYSFVSASEHSQSLIENLLYILRTHIEDNSKIGIVQLCLFILLRLSSEREFSLHFTKKSSQGEIFYDLLLESCAQILTSKSILATLFSSVLTILTNVSPYVPKMGRNGAHALMWMLDYFSNHRVLFRASENFNYLVQVIEILNLRLQYQYAGSLELVYSLLLKKTPYDRLSMLDPEKFEDKNCSLPANWKELLPIQLIDILYVDLMPRLNNLGDNACERDVLELLEMTSLVGLFPLPPPLSIKKYQPNLETDTWFLSFIWGVIFTRNQGYSFFNLNAVKLFTVAIINDNS